MRLRTLHTNSGTSGAKLNVTPLIDVVMVLIIFYLLVGRMASDRAAGVALPESRVGVGEQAARTLEVVVAASADQSGGAQSSIMLIDNIPRTQAQLEEEFAALSRAGGGTVQIRADRRLPYAAVAPIVEACRRAGLPSVRLVTQRVEGSP